MSLASSTSAPPTSTKFQYWSIAWTVMTGLASSTLAVMTLGVMVDSAPTGAPGMKVTTASPDVIADSPTIDSTDRRDIGRGVGQGCRVRAVEIVGDVPEIADVRGQRDEVTAGSGRVAYRIPSSDRDGHAIVDAGLGRRLPLIPRGGRDEWDRRPAQRRVARQSPRSRM